MPQHAARATGTDGPGIGEFHRFREAVYADPALLAELAGEDSPQFLEHVLAAGRRMGFAFERSDLEAVQRANRSEWNARGL